MLTTRTQVKNPMQQECGDMWFYTKSMLASGNVYEKEGFSVPKTEHDRNPLKWESE